MFNIQQQNEPETHEIWCSGLYLDPGYCENRDRSSIHLSQDSSPVYLTWMWIFDIKYI